MSHRPAAFGTCRVAAIWLAAMLALGAGATTALAQNPPQKIAETLHEKAREAYRAQRYKEAIELWRSAHAKFAHWKYAFNLANTLYEDDQVPEAQAWLKRAEELGLPGKYTALLEELKAKIRGSLMQKHALIELTVSPADALVRRNGKPWPAPRVAYTRDASSQIEVTRAGMVSERFTWPHPVGRRYQRAVALRSAPREGELLVTGGPAGAIIQVNGKLVGQLPMTAPLRLPAGLHTLAIRKPGHRPQQHQVRVHVGRMARLQVSLVADGSGAGRKRLAAAGWGTLGAGLALLGGGVGLVIWADGLSEDLKALGSQPKVGTFATFDAYMKAFRDTESKRDTGLAAGWALVGVGTAATISGSVLLIVDAVRKKKTRGTLRVSALPVPGGALLTGQLRF